MTSRMQRKWCNDMTLSGLIMEPHSFTGVKSAKNYIEMTRRTGTRGAIRRAKVLSTLTHIRGYLT